MVLTCENVKRAITCDVPLVLNIAGTDQPFYITLAILVFLSIVEALLLKLFFRDIPFKKHFVTATLMNSVSTIVASSILYSTNRSEMVVFHTLPAFAFMTLISAVAEYPLVQVFYRHKSTWLRNIGIIALLNVTAYSTLYCSEKLIWAGDFLALEYKQQQAVSEWNHNEILRGETGYIYLFANYPSAILERFSPETGTRELFRENPICDLGSSWNINSGKLACVSDIYSLPDFKLIKALELPSAQPLEYHYNAIPKIAPSGESIALIEPLGEVVSQKNRSAYYTYGRKANIYLYSVKTGKVVYRYPDIVLGDGGLDWSPDSKKIVFVNFRDKNLFTPIEKDMKGNISIGKNNKYPRYLYIFDLANHSLTELCEGERPSWSPDGKAILFVRNRAAYIFSLEKRVAAKLTDQDSYAYKWSPTGKNIICWSTGHLVVINVSDPKKKFIIKQNYYGPEFFWSN
jgi:hypothetical protein